MRPLPFRRLPALLVRAAPRRRTALIALAAGLALAGCTGLLGGPNPPQRFYVLTVGAEAEGGAAGWSVAARPPTIGVERVSIADYLDRTGIVSRGSGNRVEVAEFDLWAEPLDRAATTVLAENLTAMVPTDRVVVLPTSRPIGFDYRVAVSIVRFDAGSDGHVDLVARWAVFGGDPSRELGFGRVATRTPVAATAAAAAATADAATDKPYDAIAAAMSRALADLARTIAAEVRSLDARRPQSRGEPRASGATDPARADATTAAPTGPRS